MNATPKPISLVLVDDHEVVRKGTRDLITASPDFTIVAEAASGEGALELIGLTTPDVILLDINMPGKNGLDVLAEIREAFPKQRVILFTAHTDLQYIRRGVQLGANGYLSKTVSAQELQAAIRHVVQTDAPPVYSNDIAQKLSSATESAEASQLTPRELEILLHVAQGLTNRDIANELVLSVKTVDSHVAKLMKKLEMANRSQLTAYAYEQGLL